MPGRISTHVLDTYHGKPAAGMLVELHRLTGEYREPLFTARTNADGRLDESMVDAEEITTGVYELLFHAGDYFKDSGVVVTHPPFLDLVPVRFGVESPHAAYHVPLLVGPWSYSTYRGS